MAKIELLAPFILKWEGGFVNDPADLGGATNKGITIGTYETYCRKKRYPKPSIEKLKNISAAEWMDILKTLYWNRWLADNIKNQSIANILVDWVWASGVYGIKEPQMLLSVTTDGVVGLKTLAALNDYADQQELFEKIKRARVDFIERICQSRPANNRFKRGWLNRINNLTFESHV